jgi:two-component system sensor histidine kinase/response regulator
MTEKTAKILVVDDEKGMRDLLLFMLCTEGYSAVEAATGQEALDIMKDETFEVAIVDIMMPGMDGLELLRRIHDYDTDTVVIVMTAYASLQTAIEAMKFGAYDYLIKPFSDVEKVINSVARAVERCLLARGNARLLRDLQVANRRLEGMVGESQERTAELEDAYSELKERESLRAQLVTNVSHQLRTPLSLVKGYVALMVDRFLGHVPEEQALALKMVDERTDSLIQVVNDLLFVQDIENDNAYLCLDEVSLVDLVQRVCHRMQMRVQRRALTLQVSIMNEGDKEIPVMQADPLRLEQALIHLLDNAIKFSPPDGHISVELEVKNDLFHLFVRNQGDGLQLKKLADAFDKFYQVKPGGRGDLGLGLLLVKYIAELHGGDVTIKSDPQHGTTVYLTLPVEDKGRVLHQATALNSQEAEQFRAAIGVFAAPEPAWQEI